MLKKILALGMVVSMANTFGAITYQEFIMGEGGGIIDDIVENVAMPSDEDMQKLYDLSKYVDEGSYDIVRQILEGRFETDDTVQGYIPDDKAALIDNIERKLYKKFKEEYKNLSR